MAKGGERKDDDAEVDPSDIDDQIHPLHFGIEEAQHLIPRGVKRSPSGDVDSAWEEGAPTRRKKSSRAEEQGKGKRQHRGAMQRGFEVWNSLPHGAYQGRAHAIGRRESPRGCAEELAC